jgi:hypothetical protein
MAISYPPIFINDYLKEKVSQYFIDNPFDGQVGDMTIPFFPTSPTDIEALTQSFPTSNGMFAVYDRMFKMRRKAFPHIKDEQLLYYFYKMQGDPVALIITTQLVQDLLDRGDESAQDLNAWIANNDRLFTRPDGQKVYQPNNTTGIYSLNFANEEFLPVFFHDIKIYQLEETRDIIDFGTARTFAGNKIIIDYCYHTKGYSTGNTSYNDSVI